MKISHKIISTSPFQFARLDSLPSLMVHDVKFVLETRSRAAWVTAPAAPVLLVRSQLRDQLKLLPAVSLFLRFDIGVELNGKWKSSVHSPLLAFVGAAGI